MIDYNYLLEVIGERRSFFWKEEGKTIDIIINKYPFIDTFDITIVSKENPNHIINVYRNLGSYDTFDLIREHLSPLNDK